MAENKKWQSHQILPIIKHNLRHLEDGNSGGNDAIVPELTCKNYALVERGNTCKEVNKYRKKIEKECFKYNRKNLIHAVEMVIQIPDDCPKEQHTSFFKECYNFVANQLPMGEKCIFLAEVHVDEKHYSPSGNLLSKDHLHLMYVPAVQDKKHDGYSYKLCADSLTKRSQFLKFHPDLQKHLNQAGITATVYTPKSGEGKSISLSVHQLKELTKKTGIELKKTLTLDEFGSILSNAQKTKQLESLLHQKDEIINSLEHKIHTLKNEKNIESKWGEQTGWGNHGWKTSTKKKDVEVDL